MESNDLDAEYIVSAVSPPVRECSNSQSAYYLRAILGNISSNAMFLRK